MAAIRSYGVGDFGAIYDICLKTGDAGRDASALYRDLRLIGHVYAGPYGALEPESCFVVEDEQGVAGYIVGARDTYSFEKKTEREWWPELRARYPEIGEGSRDARMIRLIHHPTRTPRAINEPYPSHLHINLLPRLQGKGWGKKLIDHWLDAMRGSDSSGAHLGVGLSNERAVRFYGAYGFRQIAREKDVLVLGISFS